MAPHTPFATLALMQVPIHTVGLALLIISAILGLFAFVRHGRDRVRGWKLPAILAALLGLTGIALRSIQYTGELPAANHPLVIQGVEQAIRKSDAGKEVQSVDSHAETSFDKEKSRRLGFCVAHTPDRDIYYNYAVEWTDRKNGQFQVTAAPLVLPDSTNEQIIQGVEKSLREGPLASELLSIDGHRELAIDDKNHRRQGQCTAQLKDRSIIVNYFVQWDDPIKGSVGVSTIPADLPACDSKEVVDGIQAIVKALQDAADFEAVEELQQVRFERANVRRLGKATLRGKNGSQPMYFTVEWSDPARGMFSVKPHPGDVPACDSPEVIQSVETAVRSSEAGKAATSLDGHREISFDGEKNQREGECTVHLPDKNVSVKYLIRWANETTGQFMVEVPKDLAASP